MGVFILRKPVLGERTNFSWNLKEVYSNQKWYRCIAVNIRN